jgi:hypothetical protein
MVEDDLQRSLALARTALRAPPAVRARVRARLAAGAGAPALARGIGLPASQSVVRAALWLGVGLCAGYWLGFHRIGASLEQVVTRPREEARAAAPARASGEPSPPSVSATDLVDPRLGSAPGATPATGERATAEGHATPRTGASAAEPDERRASSAVEDLLERHPAPLPERGAADPSGSPRAARRAGLDAADSFGAELALLGRAERAIRAGEGALARSFLDELEQKFPASSLREERAAARVLADCAEARSGTAAARQAAQAAATRFVARSSSMYADRVRQLCELGPQPSTTADGLSGHGSSDHDTAPGEEPSQRGH